MKIAEPESIKAGEQELINSIMEQLNSEIIESIASGRLAVNNLEFRNGDMIIHENRIVYKMEFETSVAISVLFDREGNLIDENNETSENPDVAKDELTGESEEIAAQDSGEYEFDGDSDDDDSRMSLVMEKTKAFWLQKSEDAMEQLGTDTPEIEDEQFLDVMKRNKDFWQGQVANNVVAE